MIDLNEILKDCSQERIQWVIDKFKEFKKDCYSNEQDKICQLVINISRDILKEKKAEDQDNIEGMVDWRETQ